VTFPNKLNILERDVQQWIINQFVRACPANECLNWDWLLVNTMILYVFQ
jgi:hypothetical protein